MPWSPGLWPAACLPLPTARFITSGVGWLWPALNVAVACELKAPRTCECNIFHPVAILFYFPITFVLRTQNVLVVYSS